MRENERYRADISAQAQRDILEIEEYLLGLGAYQQNMDELVDKLLDSVDRLELSPELGARLVKKIEGSSTEIRYLIVEDYLVFYEIFDDRKMLIIYRIVSDKMDYLSQLRLK